MRGICARQPMPVESHRSTWSLKAMASHAPSGEKAMSDREEAVKASWRTRVWCCTSQRKSALRCSSAGQTIVRNIACPEQSIKRTVVPRPLAVCGAGLVLRVVHGDGVSEWLRQNADTWAMKVPLLQGHISTSTRALRTPAALWSIDRKLCIASSQLQSKRPAELRVAKPRAWPHYTSIESSCPGARCA